MSALRPWRLKTRRLASNRSMIMAILNATPDSFSDGGRFADADAGAFAVDVDAILAAAERAIHDGAEILDVGGESTRPGSDPVDEAEELRRVVPAIQALAARFDVPVSIDTYRPAVADEALKAGAEIVNDVAAGRFLASQNRFAKEDETGFPEEMADVVARHGAAVALMHMRGVPKTMQAAPPVYPDGVVEEVVAFLRRRRDAFLNAGVDPEQIAYDPGLGFGKTFEQNWTLVRRAEEMRELGGPLFFGFSRKTFLRETARRFHESVGLDADAAQPDRATLDFETAALAAILATRGVEIIRVHNTRQTALALQIARFASEPQDAAS